MVIKKNLIGWKIRIQNDEWVVECQVEGTPQSPDLNPFVFFMWIKKM